MAAATQYDPLADRDRFIVLYPDVDALDADSFGRCWRGIWAPDLEGRGAGAAAALAHMTHAGVRRWPPHPGRGYAIRISPRGSRAPFPRAYRPDLDSPARHPPRAPHRG